MPNPIYIRRKALIMSFTGSISLASEIPAFFMLVEDEQNGEHEQELQIGYQHQHTFIH